MLTIFFPEIFALGTVVSVLFLKPSEDFSQTTAVHFHIV